MPTRSIALTRPSWRDYVALCKVRVVLVLLVTALVGMLLASTSVPSLWLMLSGLLGIGLLASSAAGIGRRPPTRSRARPAG